MAHLLWFVACWAIYLGYMRRLLPAEPTVPGLAIAAAYGLCFAVACFLLSVFLARLVRRRRWPIEAGLWLGASLGLRLAVEVLLTLSERPLFGSKVAVLDAATCLFLLGPLFSRDVPLHWKRIATLMIALYGLPLLFFAGPLHSWLFGAALVAHYRPAGLVALLAIGLWLDRRKRTHGGWLHKLGLAVWTYYVLIWILLGLI